MDPKRRTATLLGALVGSACGGGGTAAFHPFESVVGVVDGGPVPDDGGAGQGGLIDLGQGIQVSRARFVISSLTLAGQLDADGGAGAPGNGNPSETVQLGPIIAEVRSGQVGDGGALGFTVSVPPGRYGEARFVVGPVDGDGGVIDPAGGMNGASFVIDGLVAEPLADGGAATGSFTFVSSLAAGQTAKPTDADAGETQTVTLTMDPRQWFESRSGLRLDPSVPATHDAIEANIQHSIRVGGHGDGGL